MRMLTVNTVSEVYGGISAGDAGSGISPTASSQQVVTQVHANEDAAKRFVNTIAQAAGYIYGLFGG